MIARTCKHADHTQTCQSHLQCYTPSTPCMQALTWVTATDPLDTSAFNAAYTSGRML